MDASQIKELKMETICSVTLYDLMAEDTDVWVTKDSKFGINIEIDDENGDPLVRDKGINQGAAESLALFCRSFLKAYELATSETN